MKIWTISDNHFFHKNIIKYCNRPFNSVEEMNEFMIRKWNEKISKKDIVIHLGDFALVNIDKIKELRKKLNGIIFLIQGSHDRRIKEYCGFIIIRGTLQIGNLLFSHRPIPLEEIPKGFVNIHGHIHEKDVLDKKKQMNVSVEKTEYEPIEICEIESLFDIDMKQVEKIDKLKV